MVYSAGVKRQLKDEKQAIREYGLLKARIPKYRKTFAIIQKDERKHLRLLKRLKET